MIRLKLLSMPYKDPDESQQNNPLAIPRWERGWGNDFSKYLEQGRLRSPLCVDLLNKLESARWSEDDCRTYLDAEGQSHPYYQLKESTRFALTAAEKSHGKKYTWQKYTWLPADKHDKLRAEMASVWPVLQALKSPILVQGIPCIHDDLGLFDAMRRMDSVFEVRYRGHLNRGTWEEIMPQIESTAYNPMRLLMAVQKGLAERPLPYPDEPMPYMPRCADAPALQGWNFSSVLYAEPYCGNGGTILPCSGDQPVDVACLHIIQKADGRLTLEQLSFQAFDYDDLLLHEVASIQPGELRWTILVLSDLWRTWPEGALLPDRWQEYRWEKTLPEYDHETANIFGFVLDSDAKTAELSEDTPALQMFRDALKVLLRATAK